MGATRNFAGRRVALPLFATVMLCLSCTTNPRDAAKSSGSPSEGGKVAMGTGNPAQGGGAVGGSNATGGNAPAGSAGSGPSLMADGVVGGSYTTEFNLNESPLSEGGKWKHTGVDWTTITTADGLAFGTQKGSGAFDDSYAYLAGTFPANQSGTATIHLESGIPESYQEVEILLRWTDSEHYSTGYECNLAYNGQYAEIIKWPGPVGKQKSDFKFISSGNPVSGGVHDGDTFQCEVVGNVITSKLNGKVLATATDSSIPSGGAPGIGFYAEKAPASRKFSFTKFTGTGL